MESTDIFDKMVLFANLIRFHANILAMSSFSICAPPIS